MQCQNNNGSVKNVVFGAMLVNILLKKHREKREFQWEFFPLI